MFFNFIFYSFLKKYSFFKYSCYGGHVLIFSMIAFSYCMYMFIYLFLSFFLPPLFPFSPTLSVLLSPTTFLSHNLSLILSLFVFLSFCFSVSLPLYLTLSFSHSHSLTLYFALSLSLSPSISISLSLSLFFSIFPQLLAGRLEESSVQQIRADEEAAVADLKWRKLEVTQRTYYDVQ